MRKLLQLPGNTNYCKALETSRVLKIQVNIVVEKSKKAASEVVPSLRKVTQALTSTVFLEIYCRGGNCSCGGRKQTKLLLFGEKI